MLRVTITIAVVLLMALLLGGDAAPGMVQDSQSLTVTVHVRSFEDCAAVTALEDILANCGQPPELPSACEEGYGWIYPECWQS